MVLVDALIYGFGALAIWSLMYRENLGYRIAEHFYVGFAAANALVMGWETIRKVAVTPLLQGNVIWIIPLILSLGWVLFLFPKTRSFYMITIAFVVGLGTALAIRSAISAQIVGQLIGSMHSVASSSPMGLFNNILIWIGSLCTLTYFIFTREIKGPLSVIPKAGRIFIMVVVGAAYANTGLGRLANFTGILTNLWTTEAIYAIPVALLVIAIDVIRRRMKTT